MLVVSVLGTLLFPLLFMTYVFWATKVYQQKITTGQYEWMSAHKYLFYKYRRHDFGGVYLFRNLLLAMTPIIPDVAVQLMFLVIILTVSVGVTAKMMPYKAPYVMEYDCVITLMLAYFVACKMMLKAEDESYNLSTAQDTAKFLFFFVDAVVLGALFHATRQPGSPCMTE